MTSGDPPDLAGGEVPVGDPGIPVQIAYMITGGLGAGS
jgi:hypothetical protein